jgi:peptidyl-prolyl cis-trans isomerase D
MILSLVVLVMTGFGLDYYTRSNQQQVYAIRVGEQTVSHVQFNQALQQELAQYRRIFGEQVYAMIDSLKINVNQQLADRMVNDLLITAAAQRTDLHVSDEEVQAFLIQQLPDRITREDYARFLQQMGETPASYEARLREDLLRQQFTELFEASSLPSRRELLAQVKLDGTKFGVDYVSFAPASFLGKTPEPTTEELRELLERNPSTYEIPARASYSYLVITPQMIMNEIPVNADDLEVAYTDRTREFTEPEQARLQQILVTVSSSASEEDKNKARSKAELALSKLAENGSFEALALEFSDDLTSKAKGGELGWVKRGDLPQVVLDAAFALKPGTLSGIIESPRGFHIVKLLEHRAETVKPLAEVQAKLEADIKNEEAPAFAAEKAHALFEKWGDSKKTLKEFAADQNLPSADTAGLLIAGSDPEVGTAGLTKLVLGRPDDRKQIVEVGNSVVLVEILDYQDPSSPSVAEATSKLTEDFKRNRSVELARAAADAFIKSVSPEKGLRAAATAEKLSVQSAKDITRLAGGEAPFNSQELRRLVVTSSLNQLHNRAVAVEGNYHVFQVTSITPPTAAEIETKLAEAKNNAAASFAQVLIGTNLKRMRKEFDNIDIDAGVLARE